MKKLFIIALLSIVMLSSCARAWESFKRDVQTSDRNYHIEHYSGGKLIGTYDFNGILNNSEASDGVYFYKDGALIELSGDLVIRSTK